MPAGRKRYAAMIVPLVTLLLVWQRSAAAELDWQPERTWVFAVGVLHWQDPSVWPGMASAQVNRRDVQLVDHFHKLGVAHDRIVFLQDEKATRSRIQHEFVRLLQQTRPDDLLIFYFTGHGFRDHKNHEVHFANYDATDGPNAWNVKSIFDIVEKHFRGKHALLLADCCYSGGLLDESRRRKTHIGYACLCSSFSHNSSTGAWTFSDSLLAGLRGHPSVDLNTDGEIDITELGQFAELEMAFVDRQKSVYDTNHGFPGRWRLSHPVNDRAARQGERVEVFWKDKWYRAQILESSGDQCKIHYAGYPNSWDEWVGPDRMRAYQPKHLPEGSAIEVLWKSDRKWYPAKVVRSWYGLTFVHYEGYPKEWDEWVNFDSIRSPGKAAQ